jgi:hypothetical protein
MSDGVTITTCVNKGAVDSTRWKDLNFTELVNQKTIMLDRYDYLYQQGNTAVAMQVLNGITLLESLIEQKMLK